jgi:hypothetical protein
MHLGMAPIVEGHLNAVILRTIERKKPNGVGGFPDVVVSCRKKTARLRCVDREVKERPRRLREKDQGTLNQAKEAKES